MLKLFVEYRIYVVRYMDRNAEGFVIGMNGNQLLLFDNHKYACVEMVLDTLDRNTISVRMTK